MTFTWYICMNVTRLSWPERVSVNCMVFRLHAKIFFFFAKFCVNLFDKKRNFHKIRKVKISRKNKCKNFAMKKNAKISRKKFSLTNIYWSTERKMNNYDQRILQVILKQLIVEAKTLWFSLNFFREKCETLEKNSQIRKNIFAFFGEKFSFSGNPYYSS